jgi:hypothetical protein
MYSALQGVATSKKNLTTKSRHAKIVQRHQSSTVDPTSKRCQGFPIKNRTDDRYDSPASPFFITIGASLGHDQLPWEKLAGATLCEHQVCHVFRQTGPPFSFSDGSGGRDLKGITIRSR